MRALIIRPGSLIEPFELPDDGDAELDALHKAIDGWITTAFRIPRSRGSVIGYCDDEFLFKQRVDWCCALGDTLRSDAPYGIGGPLVITGVRFDGATRSLTDDEEAGFTLGPVPKDSLKIWKNFRQFSSTLPLLQWEGK